MQSCYQLHWQHNKYVYARERHHPSLKMDTERKRKYGCTTSTVSSTSRATRSGQLTVTEAFKAKLPANSIRATQITKHIGAFMALDLRLF